MKIRNRVNTEHHHVKHQDNTITGGGGIYYSYGTKEKRVIKLNYERQPLHRGTNSDWGHDTRNKRPRSSDKTSLRQVQCRELSHNNDSIYYAIISLRTS